VPCMMRTETLRKLGGYDGQQRYNYEDWELSVRLLAAGYPIITIPLYLQQYRVRSDSLLRTMTAVQHQVMREALFVKHRDTLTRFAVEVTALIESEFARQAYDRDAAGKRGAPRSRLEALTRIGRQLVQRIPGPRRLRKGRQ
jgi:hypothetical protein